MADITDIVIGPTPDCSGPTYFAENKSGMAILESNLDAKSISKEIDSIERWAKKSKGQINTNFIAVSRPKGK